MFHIISYAIVWVKFTIGCFHLKIDYGKIFSSSWVADKKLFNNIIFRVEILMPCSLILCTHFTVFSLAHLCTYIHIATGYKNKYK